MMTETELQRYGIDRDELVRKAEQSLRAEPLHITSVQAPLSEGGPHDYYSNGDYWWPNPDTADGLPYVRRDGESNLNAFTAHRELLRGMRTHVANLAAGYAATGRIAYAERAAEMLRVFFLDEKTRMNPHLLYAQAIPGICTGRGIGIIDTLHLIDIPQAVLTLLPSGAITPDELSALQSWFADYLLWMRTHPYGIDEMNEGNNHGVCWYVQAASFARFTGNEEVLEFCREGYRSVLLPQQMAADGSFPRELARTKPYGYSIFVLDNMTTLCQLLSVPGGGEDDLWRFELPDGRGIRRGLDYLYPFLADKRSWPYPPDVEHHESWPVRMSFMLFAGLALDDERYMRLWSTLPGDPQIPEIRRNTAIRQPLLFIGG
ncbi:alginate lyase family protein [Paenibacillus ginsengihumi]|uniref:alginate lyase family protein n=1 Tax=Paenibacillus ginsengihumi TaxID=431596 RepID=UPI000366F28B|nr:alginate lyase family protein [Paenibacillus ginsengihumi]